MQVVVGQPETVMPGTEGLVPIFVFGALSAVEFHDPVTAEFLHVAFRRARRSQGMVHLDEIGLFPEQIQLELFWEAKSGIKWSKWLTSSHPNTSL